MIKRPIFWFSLAAILFIGGACYLILFLPYFQVSHIKIAGYETVNNADIESMVSQNAQRKLYSMGPVNIFSKSIFLFDSKKITKSIQSQYPIIKNITIKKTMPDTIHLIIEERKSFAVFCHKQNDNCFIIDREGVIFEKLQGNIENTTILMDTSDRDMLLGENVVATYTMDQISKIRENLKNNFYLDIKEAAISDPLIIETFEGWKAYFNPNEDIDLQITKMNSLLTSEIAGEERQRLEYIYLQYKDKAYYK